MGNYISNDVVITEKELIREILNLKEKISEIENEKRNQRKIINQYKSIFPKITQPMFFTDVDGKIIDANKEFSDLLGYSFFDLKRMTIKSITPFNFHQNETKILLEELEISPIIKGKFAEYYKINGEKIQVELEIHSTFDERNNFEGITRIVKSVM